MQTSKNKNVVVSIMFIAFVLAVAACASNTPSAPQANPTDISNTAIAFAWTSYAKTVTASAPTATLTPVPPTNTPRPTVTFTPAPQPIVLTGTGDSIVDVQKWNGPALMKSAYNSGSNFIVINYDSNNQRIDTMINTIGSYSGTRLLDRYDAEQTARLEVKASGPWEIQILPFKSIRQEIVPGTIQGINDDVILVNASSGNPDTIKADALQTVSNFIVYALGDNGYDLVFNEIGPYTSTALFGRGVKLIEVRAEGTWSLEITTK
jgi:hypothetical protein